MSLLGCRIIGVVMSVFTWMSYYRGGHECLYLDVVLQHLHQSSLNSRKAHRKSHDRVNIYYRGVSLLVLQR